MVLTGCNEHIYLCSPPLSSPVNSGSNQRKTVEGSKRKVNWLGQKVTAGCLQLLYQQKAAQILGFTANGSPHGPIPPWTEPGQGSLTAPLTRVSLCLGVRLLHFLSTQKYQQEDLITTSPRPGKPLCPSKPETPCPMRAHWSGLA